jgi:hypothetical protein
VKVHARSAVNRNVNSYHCQERRKLYRELFLEISIYLYLVISKLLRVKTNLSINAKSLPIQAPKDIPLVLSIKDIVGLTGNKLGYGVSQCGAYSVLMSGNLSKYCNIYVSDVIKKEIFTTEGTLENLKQT